MQNLPAGSPVALRILLTLVGLGAVSVLSAWTWAIVRVATERSLLPRGWVKAVPWGIGSIVLVIVLRLCLEFAIGSSYRYAIRSKPQPAAPAAAVKAQDVVVAKAPAAKAPKEAVAKTPQKAGNAPKAAVANAPVPGSDLTPGEMMVLVACVNAATIILVPVLLKYRAGGRLDDLGLPGTPLSHNFFRGIVAYFLLAPVVFGLMLAVSFLWVYVLKHPAQPHPVALALAKDLSPGMVTLMALSAVVFAPIAEELLFRGVLLGWLTRLWNGVSPREEKPEPGAELLEWGNEGLGETGTTAGGGPKRVSWLLPNAIVSLLFAALHAPQWPAPVPLFLLSLGLGVLYQRTGSLAAPIGLHMIFNGVSTAFMYLAVSAGVPIDGKNLDRPDPTLPPAKAIPAGKVAPAAPAVKRPGA